MDKKLYYLVVTENMEGDTRYVTTSDKEKLLLEVSDLSSLGYYPKSFVFTTNKALYAKERCKIHVQELRDTEKKFKEHMTKLYSEDTDAQVLRDTEKLYMELESTAIHKVAIAYSRFLIDTEDEEIEYYDELAIACYNMWNSKMRLNYELFKSCE